MLTAVAVLALPGFGWFGARAHGGAGWAAAAVAAGTCWVGALLALVLTGLWRRTQPLGGALGGIAFRTGLPLVVGLILQRQGGPLAEAGVLGMILLFYFLMLIVETLLAVRLIDAAKTKNEVLPPVRLGTESQATASDRRRENEETKCCRRCGSGQSPKLRRATPRKPRTKRDRGCLSHVLLAGTAHQRRVLLRGAQGAVAVARASKAEFPDVWIRLDPEFQRWEAQRLHGRLERLIGDAPAWPELEAQYLAWKHEPANFGKPLAVMLEEHYALAQQKYTQWNIQWKKAHPDGQEVLLKDFLHRSEVPSAWFSRVMQEPRFQDQWGAAKAESGSVSAYLADRHCGEWSAEKIDAYNKHLSGKILIPQPFGQLRNLHEPDSGFCISKFMVIEFVLALLMLAVFTWIGRKAVRGGAPADGCGTCWRCSWSTSATRSPGRRSANTTATGLCRCCGRSSCS